MNEDVVRSVYDSPYNVMRLTVVRVKDANNWVRILIFKFNLMNIREVWIDNASKMKELSMNAGLDSLVIPHRHHFFDVFLLKNRISFDVEEIISGINNVGLDTFSISLID